MENWEAYNCRDYNSRNAAIDLDNNRGTASLRLEASRCLVLYMGVFRSIINARNNISHFKRESATIKTWQMDGNLISQYVPPQSLVASWQPPWTRLLPGDVDCGRGLELFRGV